MEAIEHVMVRYSNPVALISLVTWLVAWYGADLLSKGKQQFLAHVLFTISNLLLIGVHAQAGQWELMAMAMSFLKTSVTGCFIHRKSITPQPGVITPEGECAAQRRQ